MNSDAGNRLRFGPFELRLDTEELLHSNLAIKIAPQPLRVLALLITRAGQLVTRDEIQQAIWGDDTFVDFDKGLNFCIRQIREALGDNAQAPIYIETLPRRGYRFLGNVEIETSTEDQANAVVSAVLAPEGALENGVIDQSVPTPRMRSIRLASAILLILTMIAVGFYAFRPSQRSTPGTGKVMLAVLPFENLNADTAQDYFSDGLTEEMITQLGRLRPDHLGVIARTTALTYKRTPKDIRQIGQELGVQYVLEGSVRRESDRVRITAQLIQVSDQTHLWADSFDRQQTDLLQIQSEVASRVARALTLELLTIPSSDRLAKKSNSPEAYDAYLKGRYLITKDTLPDFQRSISFFQDAIAKDPKFAPAYVGLVEAHVLMATWRNTPAVEIDPQVKWAAQKAVELDPSLAEAHAALGCVNFWLEWNWKEADTNLKRAIELNPSNPHIRVHYASFLSTQGKVEAGVEQVRQALQLDPVSLLTNGMAAFFYLRAGHFDQAIAQARIMREIEPKSPSASYCLTSAYALKGMYEEAVQNLREDMRRGGAKDDAIAKRTSGKARDVVRELRRESLNDMRSEVQKGEKIPATYLAAVCAELGETDEAFSWLEKGWQRREPMFIFFPIHPSYTSLHGDPRLAELARRTGLSLY